MEQRIYLSVKQSKQIINMRNKFQSYLPLDGCTFDDFTFDAIDFVRLVAKHQNVRYRNFYIQNLKNEIQHNYHKHYANGFKINKNSIFTYCRLMHPRMINPRYQIIELETIAIMKTLRAFRDFAYSGLKNEDEFIERLIKISNLISDYYL